MTRTQILSEIASKQKDLKQLEISNTSLLTYISTAQRKRDEWLAEYNKLSASKKKTDDGKFKYSKYIEYRDAVVDANRKYQTQETTIGNLKDEIATLQKSLDSINKENQILASQGTSSAALELEAIAKGEAQLRIADATAGTISDEAKNKKVRNIIIWSFVALLLVFLAIFIYRKFIKKS
jgi:predicted RNase H-like nuclease (RuvC/YqgF family)